MRRIMALLAGVFVLSAASGCCITTGQCDCDPGYDKCTLYQTGHAPTAGGMVQEKTKPSAESE